MEFWKKIFFMRAKIEKRNRGEEVAYDFKRISDDALKSWAKIFKRSNAFDNDEDHYELFCFHVTRGRITLKGQPLCSFLVKTTKVYHRDANDLCVLCTLVNPSVSHPFIASRQLGAKWVVEAWEQVQETLIRITGTTGIVIGVIILKMYPALMKHLKQKLLSMRKIKLMM